MSKYMGNATNRKQKVFSTALLKTLDFFLLNPDLEFSDMDVYRAEIGIGKSAINSALRELANLGWIKRKRKGKSSTNKLLQTEPVVAHLKILSSMLTIDSFVTKCRPLSHKIVLFGSRADGTYGHDSDFDILIVTDEVEKVYRLPPGIKIPVQLIVKTPEEMMLLHEIEPTLAGAISKGITLWERT